MHNTKTFVFDGLKAISEAGTFEGWLSTYGNLDDVGDVVEVGSYSRTLSEKGNTRPLLWQHQSDVILGTLTLEDRQPQGLWCKGQLLMDLPKAKEAYLLLKAGVIGSLSIGFQSVRDQIKGGVRHLEQIKLFEGSLVTFPANELAVVTSVKSRESGQKILAALAEFKADVGAALETPDDFNEELAEIQTLSGFSQMLNALEGALCETVWSDLTPNQKINAAETIVQQFGTAFNQFFPAYLSVLTETYGPIETWASRQKLQTKTATTAREIRQTLEGKMLKVARVNLARKKGK